ncbi:hypothetical protein [Caviibacter abscessus]|uniref:hypothetical protein n=1 Tax=Caviibacter abscessus TaxID=1766719 RepID=UPI000832188F|nr:hypothetical protein [Caviibacter abscessus]
MKKLLLLFSFITICLAKENLKLEYNYNNGHKIIVNYNGKYVDANTNYELSLHSNNEKDIFGRINLSYINENIKLGGFTDYKYKDAKFHFEAGLYAGLILKTIYYYLQQNIL